MKERSKRQAYFNKKRKEMIRVFILSRIVRSCTHLSILKMKENEEINRDDPIVSLSE